MEISRESWEQFKVGDSTPKMGRLKTTADKKNSRKNTEDLQKREEPELMKTIGRHRKS